MSNVSEHRHRFTSGKCSNKENESSNGRRIEVTKSSNGIDSNFDWAKKEAIHQQRKLRLIQVTNTGKNYFRALAPCIFNERQHKQRNKRKNSRCELIFLFFFSGATTIKRVCITSA